MELIERVRACCAGDGAGVYELLAEAAPVTDANAALFDADHNFSGCIAGIQEVLPRQGLLQGRRCLDPNGDLSPGQLQEIDRVCTACPEPMDDDFVAGHLDRRLR